MATAIKEEIPTVLFGAKSADPFPCVDGLWTLFSRKGIKTVFTSLGSGASAQVDLEIAETLGCPINVVALDAAQKAQWDEVAEILKARARVNAKHLFSEGAEDKWILPKNLRVYTQLPGWSKATITPEESEAPVETIPFFSWVEGACRNMSLKEADTRLDIVKVTLPYELEQQTLYAMLNAGFRPAILMIQWAKMPNADVPTSLVAGHLQTAGYMLLKTLDNKFLYLYTDNDWYETCSWEDTTSRNPMVAEIIKMVKNYKPKSEGVNGHAKFTSESEKPVPTPGETAPVNSVEETAPQS